MKKALVLWMMWVASAAWAQEPPLIDLASELQQTGGDIEPPAPPTASEQPKALELQPVTKPNTKTEPESKPVVEPPKQVEPAKWSYAAETAPRFWGKLDARYAMCDQGLSQSPINLADRQSVNTSGLPGLDIAYREMALRLNLTDYDLVGEYPLGSYIKLGDERYEFTHYQFKTPSEHHIGGFAYPMEIQLYHRDGEGRHVVMSIIVQEGDYNEPLQTIINNIPRQRNKLKVFEKLNFNPVQFLPEQKEFYRYMGSLTQPPCSQGVVWMVFKQPIEASIGQLMRINQVLGDNVRPIQAVNGRIVMKSWMSDTANASQRRPTTGYYYEY